MEDYNKGNFTISISRLYFERYFDKSVLKILKDNLTKNKGHITFDQKVLDIP